MRSALVSLVSMAAAALLCPAAASAQQDQPTTLSGGDAAALAQSLNDLALPGNRRAPGKLAGTGCGGRGPAWRAGALTLKAGAIRCTMSNVAVGSMTCDVLAATGPAKKTASGLQAYALISALRAAGIQGEGAAGSMHWGARSAACTVDPKAWAECSGGGISCTLAK